MAFIGPVFIGLKIGKVISSSSSLISSPFRKMVFEVNSLDDRMKCSIRDDLSGRGNSLKEAGFESRFSPKRVTPPSGDLAQWAYRRRVPLFCWAWSSFKTL